MPNIGTTPRQASSRRMGGATCSALGCEAGAECSTALGPACNKHYLRVLTHGTFDLPERRLSRHMACKVGDCTSPGAYRGFCKKHYTRWRVHGDPLTTLKNRSPNGAPAAFIESLPASGSGCVRWPYTITSNGYAQINLNGKRVGVHRLVCERFNGPPLGDGMAAAHSCGKGHEGCVAPWHLSWKTYKQNSEDMLTHGTKLRGSAVGGAKLDDEDVLAIRKLSGSASQREIARKFGVTQQLVSHIVRRTRWGHI